MFPIPGDGGFYRTKADLTTVRDEPMWQHDWARLSVAREEYTCGTDEVGHCDCACARPRVALGVRY